MHGLGCLHNQFRKKPQFSHWLPTQSGLAIANRIATIKERPSKAQAASDERKVTGLSTLLATHPELNGYAPWAAAAMSSGKGEGMPYLLLPVLQAPRRRRRAPPITSGFFAVTAACHAGSYSPSATVSW